MQVFLIFLFLLILALLESTVIPLNLTLIAVISWAARRPPDEGLVTAFLAGLGLDLLAGRTLGLTSLTFLLSSLPIYLYKNRFQAEKWQFLLPYSLLTVVFFNFFFGHLSLSLLFFTSILVILLLPIFRFLAKETGKENQLKF